MKPVTHKSDWHSIVVMKDGSEISSFSRKIKGSSLIIESYVDLVVPSGVKVLKEAAKSKGKKANVYRMMEIPIAAIEGLKGRK